MFTSIPIGTSNPLELRVENWGSKEVFEEEREDGKENNGRVRARLESQWCRSGNSNVRRAAATWTDYYWATTGPASYDPWTPARLVDLRACSPITHSRR